jgi:hypothetical protein
MLHTLLARAVDALAPTSCEPSPCAGPCLAPADDACAEDKPPHSA